MSSTPEQYNRTRGPALAVLVLDAVRQQPDPISTRALAKRLAAANGQSDPQHFSALYYRVRIVVRSLADAGLITTRTQFDPRNRVNVTLITLAACSASPQT